METTTGDSQLDFEAIDAFFEKLGVAISYFDPEALGETKLAQEAHWEETLLAYQKIRSGWAKEWLRLDQLLSAKEQKPKLIEQQLEVEAEAHRKFNELKRPLLEARAREEVARALPDALEDPEAARFVARQLRNAKTYLGMA